MSHRIFVALSTFSAFDPEPIRLLVESGMEYSLNHLGRRLSAEEITQFGRSCTGIIAGVEPYTKHVLQRLSTLRCISRCGVGIDNIDVEEAAQRGIEILNTPDVVVAPTAELTIAMILDLLRKVSQHAVLMKSGKWEKSVGHSLAGKRVGIIGLGRIGKRVSELLLKLGARVCAYDLAPDRAWATITGVLIVSLEELLSSSDVISLHLAPVPGSPFCLGKDQIARMKAGSYLVNVSRGMFVDESALSDALSSGHLAGAALDVFRGEPYRGPLCDLENVLLTPHIATLTVESRSLMEREAVMNLLNFLKLR